MEEYTNIEAQVEFATSKIDSERRFEISLRELIFVYKTVGELIRFFHQPYTPAFKIAFGDHSPI
jgi:hypothetical protein